MVIVSLSRYSEEYTPQGNIAAEGILNQLGKPGLDLLSLLVRETVQNSRDARSGEHTPVHFSLCGQTLTADQWEYLRTVILPGFLDHLTLPETPACDSDNHAQVLLICDRGTSGLDGPTRANAPDDRSQSRNFVNFFYNTGQSKGKLFSGGTYGYGKSVLYRISQIHTICVHTRCKVNGKLESRFMAAALDPQPDETQARYRTHTGRHWWGRFHSDDGILDPVIGDEADEIAHELGFPGFQHEEQGTTCMILFPLLGEHTLTETMQYISRLLLWYAWPAMLAKADGFSAMHFSVWDEHVSVTIPSPASYPPLQGFVQAMNLLRNTTEDRDDYLDRSTALWSQRPRQLLGRVALSRYMTEGQTDPLLQPSEASSAISFPISRNVHHVALLRNTDLVIKYLEGPSLPISTFEYAGVFITDRAVDAIFAKAEPPTHDDWNPQTLQDRTEKLYVNVALRRIKEIVQEFTSPDPVGALEGDVQPLGDFADRLGSFLFGVQGPAGYISPLPATAPKSLQTAGQNNHGLVSKPVGENLEMAEGEQSEAFDDHGVSAESFGPDFHGSPHPFDQDEQKKEAGTQPPVTSPRKPAEIQMQGDGRLEIMEDHPVVMAVFRVEHATGSQATDIEVESTVLLDNGESEKDPPPGMLQPEVLAWITSEGKIRSGSDVLRIPATDTGIWQVAVTLPEDAMIQVNLIAREVR